MGIFESELTLPGVITEVVNDYSSGYDKSSWGTTESVTIIGTAFNGPVGQVVKIYSKEMAKYIFGDSFDPVTKREASLVPEIYDAWDKGCRTIYAVRISGKDMYKDYDLATESPLKLRLSGKFPCNDNKACYMTYQATQGSEKAFGETEGILRIYKPADRTVISEKMAGVVDNLDSILVTEISLDENGFTKASRLIDLINLVNNSVETNNVLKLSLVDENGVEKTSATKEVQEITIGALFPGIYTICRDEATADVKVVTDVSVVRTSDAELYPGCTENVWKKLVINTNPAAAYPIYGKVSDLKVHLPNSLTIDEHYNYLKNVGAIDAIATKNKIDYEEVDLDGFELYKKLGTGYARTATLKEMKKLVSGSEEDGDAVYSTKYKVVPAPDGDEYKVVGINDGIYSTLQMHESDYVVLAAATAETDLTEKLPKKQRFLRAKSKIMKLKNDENQNGVINVSAKIDNEDINSQQVMYDIKIGQLPEGVTQEGILKDISKAKFVRLPKATEGLEAEGIKKNQLAFTGTKIQTFDGTKFVDLDSAAFNDSYVITEDAGKLAIYQRENADGGPYSKMEDFSVFGTDKAYVVATLGTKANIYMLDIAAKTVEPLMSLQDLADESINATDYTVTFIEEQFPILSEETPNHTYVRVFSNLLEYCSIEEFVDEMKGITPLAKIFDFEVADVVSAADDFPEEAIAVVEMDKEKEPVYNTTLHIPYTTTDNFARHLAQHCLYTSLKTYPTHGVIGCDRLNAISLGTIAKRVEEICSLDLDMYAKKSNGNNMLDSNNLPYPIGRCLSVTFMQYPIGTGNGYMYTSSGAAGYAGMISTLDADRSSTNQPIDIEEDNLMFNLSEYQLKQLNTAGIVCCRVSTTQGVVVVDGITQAPATSVYRRLSTTKIINVVGRRLKTAIEPYIGLPQSDAYLNAMETAIKSTMNQIVGVLINDYNYEVVTDPASRKLGTVKINYAIVPAYEIRQVYNSISVTDANS